MGFGKNDVIRMYHDKVTYLEVLIKVSQLQPVALGDTANAYNGGDPFNNFNGFPGFIRT